MSFYSKGLLVKRVDGRVVQKPHDICNKHQPVVHLIGLELIRRTAVNLGAKDLVIQCTEELLEYIEATLDTVSTGRAGGIKLAPGCVKAADKLQGSAQTFPANFCFKELGIGWLVAHRHSQSVENGFQDGEYLFSFNYGFQKNIISLNMS